MLLYTVLKRWNHFFLYNIKMCTYIYLYIYIYVNNYLFQQDQPSASLCIIPRLINIDDGACVCAFLLLIIVVWLHILKTARKSNEELKGRKFVKMQ